MLISKLQFICTITWNFILQIREMKNTFSFTLLLIYLSCSNEQIDSWYIKTSREANKLVAMNVYVHMNMHMNSTNFKKKLVVFFSLLCWNFLFSVTRNNLLSWWHLTFSDISFRFLYVMVKFLLLFFVKTSRGNEEIVQKVNVRSEPLGLIIQPNFWNESTCFVQ